MEARTLTAPAPWMAAGATIAGVAAVTAATSAPALCPFRVCTGMACPGCGMSRAAWRGITGDWSGSMAMHPWIVPLVIQTFVVAVVIGRTGKRPGWLDRLLAFNGVALVVVWLVRWRLGLLDAVL